MSSRAKRNTLGVALAAAVVMALPMASASAVDVPGTATLTGGTLDMTTPAALTFTATLTGVTQTVTALQPIDIRDLTGSGAGWNITLTSTTFNSGTAQLANNASSENIAPSGACDVAAACTLGDNTGVGYPVAIPAAAAAPTAVKIQTAAASTGLVGQTWTHTMALVVPSNARAGAYHSTWTYSLISAP